LRSVYTSNLPNILAQLDISLVVSTYQAGKVVLIRNDGGGVNTHFRTFKKPMGMAVHQNRLTIGGAKSISYLRNMPAVARKLEPPGKHDACYLPRRVHVTGDIDIHEMAYAGDDELWIVNTRFCCLCTLDQDHSFYPRWRPHFVTALAPQDRCHLNGLAMVNGQPKYVTTLGETDTPGGWRANKKDGGILMDVETNEILLRGLSMPHSPRWYWDRLWLLEGGFTGAFFVKVGDRSDSQRPGSGGSRTRTGRPAGRSPGYLRGRTSAGGIPPRYPWLAYRRRPSAFQRSPAGPVRRPPPRTQLDTADPPPVGPNPGSKFHSTL